MKPFVLSIALLLALTAPAAAQTGLLPQTPGSSAAQSGVIGAGDATIGPRDVLEVRVIEDPTVSGRVTVTDEGQIVLQVVGKVDVAGLSAAQVETKLKTMLETSFIRKATVSVQVVEFGSQPISVLGAVLRPGRIGASSSMTLIQAITQAGGLTSNYGKELYILRTARNGLTEQLAVDIEDLMVNGNPDLNIPLAPNDLINVPVDTPISVYVVGEVMRPGKVQFRRSQTPTLVQAIAEAGGPTDRAKSTVRVLRMENGKEVRIERNYGDITRGKASDLELKDGDRIVIEESFF
jgi:polysaccharide export outer membrane protein